MFIPLHVYTGYSFLRSGLRIEQYLKEAKKMGYSVLGICDQMSLTGAPHFVEECQKYGIKPIVGEDLLIEGLLVSFFVINEIGYRNLTKMSSLAKTGSLLLSDIKSYSNGLAVIIDMDNSLIKDKFTNELSTFPHYLAELTKGITNLYLGINDYGENREYMEKVREFISNYPYDPIAFPIIKYLKKEDAIVLKMFEAINKNETIEEKSASGNHYFLSNKEIEHLYTEEEIKNTAKLASLVNFDLLTNNRGKMVKFKNDLNLSSDEYLTKLASDGLKKLGLDDLKHIDRLNEELNVIKSMGFSDYFLIVSDYVNFARNNNIPVGPGRGSAGGSLVAHALGITVIDPLEYDLLFERFLNKARQTMPDIDVDFSDIKRELVVEYIKQKYGRDHVSNIMAVQTIGAKQSLRDIGRIYNYPQRDIDLLAKLIPTHHSQDITLRETYKTVPQFKNLLDKDKYYLEIVSLASKIEGFPRQRGMHAAGIVINAEPLNEVIPVTSDINGNLVEEYEMNYLEKQGFLKMDILSIRNLTIVEEVLEKLKAKGINLKMDDIPYKDKEAIDVIAKGNTTGIFQLESKGMRNAILTVKPENFEDIVAILSLFRPGPMQEIKSYANRKMGKERIDYISPITKKILAPTYGIIVYQEQIMQIASLMAGLSLSEADLFRRAISKKDTSKLASLKETFIRGCLKNGYKRDVSEDVFKSIYKFADYGFNKSHSVSYAVFSCRMAYLKAKYPEEFYASILDNTGGESDSFTLAISEIKSAKIKIKGPDVTSSGKEFIIKDGALLFPLNRIKGLFNEVANNIILERESNGPFYDYYDFVTRMKRYKLASSQLMKLIDAGALDSLDKSRASLRLNMSNAIAYANMIADDEGTLIIDMRDFAKPVYEHIEDDLLENLNKEYESLGLMLSGSPLDLYKDKLSKIKLTSLVDVASSRGDITIAGIIKTIKTIKTKKGTPMAFMTIYDESGELEVTLFSDIYEMSASFLKRNKVVVIKGYYQLSRNTFNVSEILPVEEMKNE